MIRQHPFLTFLAAAVAVALFLLWANHSAEQAAVDRYGKGSACGVLRDEFYDPRTPQSRMALIQDLMREHC